MPATTVLDADQLARDRFKKKVRDALPPGVPEPDEDEVDDTALQIGVRATANRALGPPPTTRSLGMHGLDSNASTRVEEARRKHEDEAKALAGLWSRWINAVGETPKEKRLPGSIPAPPGDPSDPVDVLHAAGEYFREQQRSSDPEKFEVAARVICWRLAMASALTD